MTQGALGAAFAQSAATREKTGAFAVAGLVGGLAPDLDVLIRSETDPLLYLEFHRQFTHSLAFIPVGAALCTAAVYWLLRKRLSLAETYFACLLGYATHGLLDACTSYGTQLYWPFSDERLAWNLLPVVDPLVSLPLLALAGLAALTRRPMLARLGVAWVLAMVLLASWQQHRVEAAQQAVAQARGHELTKALVKPSFGNLLLWKSVYEHERAYYVDAFRAAQDLSLCPGEQTQALRLPQDLPWLDKRQRQADDLERFRWYSDDWLALDPEEPHTVVDVRYSSVPNQLGALWGLQLDPAAAATDRARYLVFEDRRTRDTRELQALLGGAGCEPVTAILEPVP
ncbi:MAG: metal-dependent hydrolase [Pseudomonadota bacterium]